MTQRNLWLLGLLDRLVARVAELREQLVARLHDDTANAKIRVALDAAIAEAMAHAKLIADHVHAAAASSDVDNAALAIDPDARRTLH